VSFEHAAAGAAQIVPRHTSMPELWEDAAELVEPRFSLITEVILNRAYYTLPDDVAAAMHRLYEDRERRERLADAALRRVSEPRFGWDDIAARWDELFTATLEKNRGVR
jgi:glycosyltransferase involved in cell wall biosynthesis